jgi:hypothetical protein
MPVPGAFAYADRNVVQLSLFWTSALVAACDTAVSCRPLSTRPPEVNVDQNTIVILVVVTAATLLTALALWLGRGLKIRRRDTQISVDADRRQSVSVADGATMTRVRAGKIVGIEGSSAGDHNVSVANRLTITEGEVASIVGVSSDPGDRKRGSR